MNLTVKVMPSLLAGDFGNLEASARLAEAAGADTLHLDIMDGHFVPNLSMGPDVVRMVKRRTHLALNVHLMLTHPQNFVDVFADAGAATLLIHIEAHCDVRDTLRRIRARGVRPGLAINPETPVEALAGVLDEAEEVLCMTVHPGFGGQKLMPEVLPKIRKLRDGGVRGGSGLDIAVDGGIDRNTVAGVAAAGANLLVAGNALYSAPDFAAEFREVLARSVAAFRPSSPRPNP